MSIVLAALMAAAVAQGQAEYRVRLSLDPPHGALYADVDIDLPNAPATTNFILGRSYSLERAIADNAEVKIARSDNPLPRMQTIEVRRRRAGRLHLRVIYAGRLQEGNQPPIDEISPSRIELNLDSFWLPVETGFAMRFGARTEISGVPSDLTVVAQGRVRRINGQVIIERDVPDFDIAFVAARTLKRLEAPGFELYAQNLNAAEIPLFRTHGAGAVKFLTRWFGPMPGAPSRVVVVNRKRDSGYARVGYIVVKENDKANEADVAKYIAHEFSHAWWAPVDPQTEDRWLQESIAEYVALRYVEQALGHAAMLAQIAAKRAEAARAGPLLGHGAVGDDELYAKGPLLLMGLEARIGRDRLDDMLRRLAQRPPHRTAEFLAVLSYIAGHDVARAFENQLRT